MKSKLLLFAAVAVFNAHAMDTDPYANAKQLIQEAALLPLKNYRRKITDKFPQGIEPALHAFSVATTLASTAQGLEAGKKIKFLTKKMKVCLDCFFDENEKYSLLHAAAVDAMLKGDFRNLCILLGAGAHPLKPMDKDGAHPYKLALIKTAAEEYKKSAPYAEPVLRLLNQYVTLEELAIDVENAICKALRARNEEQK